MEIMVYVRFFFDDHVQKDSSKNKIISNLKDLIDLPNSKLDVNTDVIVMHLERQNFDWEKVVFELISLSQKIAHSWIITGNIGFD
ncbi:hypothetical protein ACEYX6_08710 [Acinetobacter sp. c2-A9]